MSSMRFNESCCGLRSDLTTMVQPTNITPPLRQGKYKALLSIRQGFQAFHSQIKEISPLLTGME